jgi:hypothetical protein
MAVGTMAFFGNNQLVFDLNFEIARESRILRSDNLNLVGKGLVQEIVSKSLKVLRIASSTSILNRHLEFVGSHGLCNKKCLRFVLL